MDANVINREALHRRSYVYRIKAEAIKLRDNEHIAWFKSIQQMSELWTLAGRDAAANLSRDALIRTGANRKKSLMLATHPEPATAGHCRPP